MKMVRKDNPIVVNHFLLQSLRKITDFFTKKMMIDA